MAIRSLSRAQIPALVRREAVERQVRLLRERLKAPLVSSQRDHLRLELQTPQAILKAYPR